ncbi:hypothetical protein DE146DRAFT_738094 [Phaeosphaeria sp. MPI-PUGE-AT-0046c]|nr:hypothetical protein DE146DRAFT_738094 [Phaeosphaeria sp. MPI-PUGE-AT-0046c]
MHKLSRTSLAAIVCPSAPFLAPRLLRTAAPVALQQLQSAPYIYDQRSCYTIAAKGKKKADQKYAARSQKPDERVDARANRDGPSLRLAQQLREACETRDVDTIMALYPTLLQTGALDRQDTRRIAQALHARTRQKSRSADLYPFIQQLVADTRSGALDPHPYAFVHLLSIYKEYKRFSEGNELWQWLEQQDDTYVSQAAYGAAIELLAYGRMANLQELENLYREGLKRFPGVFAEYHLSPDAIVPDRTQSIAVSGVPILLLQGILTARLLARNWKQSYLAFDTVLRLYPTQTPPRFFELFMAERPISEAYTVFMVACRAGTVLLPGHATSLLTKLRIAMSKSKSMADRMVLLRAAVNALYAYQEAGGSVESLHVGAFLHCFEYILPEQTAGEDFHGETAILRNITVLSAHEILGRLIQAGLSARIHPFAALISVAGSLRVPELLTTVLQDIKAAQLDLGPIGTRSALTSAGLVKNQGLIKELWSHVVATADAEGSQIAFEDWITFTKACRRADLGDYFRDQLSRLAHTTTASTNTHLMYQIDLTEREINTPDFGYMSAEELTAEFEGLKQQMKNVEAVLMSGQPLDLQSSPFYMHIDPATSAPGSLDNLRAVYDGFTTDPHQPPPVPTADGSQLQPAMSPTKIPFDELRFMNWLSVLEMMIQAESNENLRLATVNQAMAAGTPANDTSLVFMRHTMREPLETVEKLRERIITLRNGKGGMPLMSRKIVSKDSDGPVGRIKRLRINNGQIID